MIFNILAKSNWKDVLIVLTVLLEVVEAAKETAKIIAELIAQIAIDLDSISL